MTTKQLFSPVLMAAALAALPLTAQSSILPYLPKDTMMVVEAPDLAGSMADFGKMPLAKIWHEEEVQQFVQDLVDMGKGQFDRHFKQLKEMHAQGAFPVDPDKLMALRVQSLTFAITKLDLVMGKYQPEPSIGMVVWLDFGDSAKEWFGLVQMGLGMLEQQAGANVARTDSKVGDATVVNLAPTRANAPPMSLCVAMQGNGLLIGTLESEVKAILTSLQAGTPVLSTTDDFKASAATLDAQGSEMRMFMRMGPGLDFAMKALGMAAQMEPDFPVDPDGIGRAIDALGLRGIKSMGATSTYENGMSVSRSYTVAPAPERRGLTATSNKNLDTGFLKWVPKEAVSFGASTMEPMGIYDALANALKAYDPNFAEMALGQLAEMEKQVGFTLRDDLFGSMGDGYAWWMMPMGTITAPPEAALVVKVKDQERLVKVLKSLSAMTDGMVEIEEGEKRGIKAFQIRVNADPSGGMGVNPFDILSPTFSFHDGYLVAGFSPSDVKRVIDRMGREDDPKGDIRGNKEFAPYLAKLPAEMQSLSFTDWKAQFEGIYQMITGVLAFVPVSEEIPLDMSLLPESNTITKHLFGSITYTQVDANGFTATSMGPFGPEVLAIIGAAIGAGAGVAATRRGF